MKKIIRRISKDFRATADATAIGAVRCRIERRNGGLGWVPASPTHELFVVEEEIPNGLATLVQIWEGTLVPPGHRYGQPYYKWTDAAWASHEAAVKRQEERQARIRQLGAVQWN
jgi:hypothetical protein